MFNKCNKIVNSFKNNVLCWFILAGHILLVQTTQAVSQPFKSLAGSKVVSKQGDLPLELMQVGLVFLENSIPKWTYWRQECRNLGTPSLQECNKNTVSGVFVAFDGEQMRIARLNKPAE